MSAAAQLIKDRMSIVDVVGSYIKLENAGGNYKAKCPFHNEKTPSFFVSPARGSYYCFGCGVKGDIFSFVQEFEKIDFLGALKILAERAGIELDQFKSENYQKVDRQYKIMDLACSFFQNKLSDIHKEYLLSRGLEVDGITSWRIGFAPDEWRSLMDYMLRQKIDGKPVMEEELINTGLIKRGENSGGAGGQAGSGGANSGGSVSAKIYDRFRSRIMFPIFDSSGRVIAFSGRIYGKDEKDPMAGAKYLNSPEMDLFNKSETLYGFDRAKQSMRERGYAVLVEGQMDLLMSHQIGVTNSVATSGTALTRDHLFKIGRMTKNIIFMYDADNAGYGATRRGERMAIELGFDVKVAILPKGEDPASLIVKNKQAFMKALKESTHVITYYLSILIEKHSDQHDLIKAIEKELVPDIALTPSAIRRAELISQIALRAKVSEKAIAEEVEKATIEIEKQGGFKEKNDASASTNSSKASSEDLSMEDNEAIGNKKSGRASSKSVDIALRRAVALVVYMEGKTSVESVDALWSRIDNMLSIDDRKIALELREYEKEELLFEAEMLFGNVEKASIELESLLTELEERSLKGELSRLMTELQLAEKVKDKVKSDEIIAKCQEISLKLSSLHKLRRDSTKIFKGV